MNKQKKLCDVPPCVLVCVTVQKECDRLIKSGMTLSHSKNLSLNVLHVSTDNSICGSQNILEPLNYLYSLAHEYHAEMDILYEKNVLQAIQHYALEHNAKYIVLGVPNNKHSESGVSSALKALLPNVEFVICNA